MALTGTQAFQDWVADRIAEDRERNPELDSATECTSCGAALKHPGHLESETCRTCLATEFGVETAEREIGSAVSRLVGVLLSGEPARIGALVSEAAVHVGEVADRLLEDDALAA